MSLEYINNTYGVQARVGGRIRYTGGKKPVEGTITGARNQYVRVLLDGQSKSKNFHPTWEIEYLT